MTLHAIDDPTAFVEHESAYRATREGAGTADTLVQVFSRESEHSSLSNSGYAAVLDALDTWVDTGVEADARRRRGLLRGLRHDVRQRLLPRPDLRAGVVRQPRRGAPGRPPVADDERRAGAGLVADPGHRDRAVTRG